MEARTIRIGVESVWGKLTAILERVKQKLFGRSIFANAALGDTYITDDMATAISRWAMLYSNKAPWLAKNSHGMGLPAAIAREVATLVTLEMNVEVTDPNHSSDQMNGRAIFIKDAFDGILPQMQVQVEYACALGGMVFKPYVANGKVAIDYVHADDFYPVSFNSRGEIRGAIFLEHKKCGKEYFTRIERHDMTEEGYIVTNRVYKSHSDSDIGTEVALSDVEDWAGLQPETIISQIDYPLFAYFRIPQGNVIDKRSLLGVSVFGRADNAGLIEEADLQWQRLMWEYEAGEMAIDASEDIFKHIKAPNGEVVPVLPIGKERLFRMNNITIGGNNNADLIKPYSPTLRDDSYASGLNNILMRIEDTCGLARGTLSDANDQVRTATELRISRQRSYATITAIQRSLETALDNLAKAISAFATLYKLAPDGDYDITYIWDDSIVVDAAVEREKDRVDVRDGLMLPWEYRVKWYGESEQQAKATLAESADLSDDEIMGFRERLASISEEGE